MCCDRKRADGKKHNADQIWLIRQRCDVLYAMLENITLCNTPLPRRLARSQRGTSQIEATPLLRAQSYDGSQSYDSSLTRTLTCHLGCPYRRQQCGSRHKGVGG
ncbi:hypothetical protein CQZ88_10290 [Rhodococcus sp. ENV425]|nr:hypothetical protein CQZ88_10290 [Rhodococcus sp. ENV425]